MILDYLSVLENMDERQAANAEERKFAIVKEFAITYDIHIFTTTQVTKAGTDAANAGGMLTATHMLYVRPDKLNLAAMSTRLLLTWQNMIEMGRITREAALHLSGDGDLHKPARNPDGQGVHSNILLLSPQKSSTTAGIAPVYAHYNPRGGFIAGGLPAGVALQGSKLVYQSATGG
jgi:hypothetical protein